MTNDTTALQERLARAFWEYETGPSGIPWERFAVRCPEVAAERMRNVAPFLPIIAAEVQAAKAEALREAADGIDLGEIAEEWSQGPGNRDDMHWAAGNAASSVVITLHDRATEYKTGERA